MSNVAGQAWVAYYTYIGLKDVIGDNRLSSYRWMADNSKMVYSDFYQNEPAGIDQHCIILHRYPPHRWHDIDCFKKFPALCEGDYVSSTLLT